MKAIWGLGTAIGALAFAGQVHAQSMADAVTGFSIAINDYCAPALLMALPVGQVPPSPLAKIVPADSQAREMMRAGRDDQVWAVEPGGDAVFIKQAGNGDCDVTALGPSLAKTFETLTRVLTARPLAMRQIPAASSPDNVRLTFKKTVKRDVLMIEVVGGEPGMPNHASQVSVLTAVVRRISGAVAPST
jgi:hypothetical protein